MNGVKLVLNRILFRHAFWPLLITSIVVLLIIIITLILVKKEINKK